MTDTTSTEPGTGAGPRTPAGEPRWLSDAEQLSWRKIIAGATFLLDQLDRDLRNAHDLTLADYEILVHLSEAADDRMRMADLAEAALVSRSRLTHRIDRLADRGLVSREACETDKRGTFAVLTPQGREVIVTSAPTHVESVRRFVIDRLAPRQLEALGDAMGVVARAVRAADEE